jgi:hypothetical protein
MRFDTYPSVLRSTGAELRPVLDMELGRLPSKYQSAIVLCDLESRSRQEAARLLKISEGTLSSRLARGRRLLARRLARFAPVVSGSVTSTLAGEAATAAPALLVSSTMSNAMFMAGAATMNAVPARVGALTQGVLKMMFISKVKLMTATLLLAGMICTSVAVLAPGLFLASAQTADKTSPIAESRQATVQPNRTVRSVNRRIKG